MIESAVRGDLMNLCEHIKSLKEKYPDFYGFCLYGVECDELEDGTIPVIEHRGTIGDPNNLIRAIIHSLEVQPHITIIITALKVYCNKVLTESTLRDKFFEEIETALSNVAVKKLQERKDSEMVENYLKELGLK